MNLKLKIKIQKFPISTMLTENLSEFSTYSGQIYQSTDRHISSPYTNSQPTGQPEIGSSFIDQQGQFLLLSGESLTPPLTPADQSPKFPLQILLYIFTQSYPIVILKLSQWIITSRTSDHGTWAFKPRALTYNFISYIFLGISWKNSIKGKFLNLGSHTNKKKTPEP